MNEEKAENGKVQYFKKISTLTGHKDIISQIKWSQDGKRVLTASKDKSIRMWNASTGELILEIGDQDRRVKSIAWSQDDKIIVAGYSDGKLKLFDSSNFQLIKSIVAHNSSIQCLEWSPNGDMFASASKDMYIKLWDIAGSELSSNRLNSTFPIKSINWSPDGRYIASCSDIDSIAIWDIEKLILKKLYSSHSNRFLCISWSPNGTLLAAGSDDSTIHIWNFSDDQHIRVLEGHTDNVTSIGFSFDGNILASRSTDNTIKFWNCVNWGLITSLEETNNHIDSIASIILHPSTYCFATCVGWGLEINLWDFDASKLLSVEPIKSIQYINAKVVLVGESSVGKSGLGIRMAEKTFRTTESTHGAQFWQVPIDKNVIADGIKAELTIWDFAGQSEYHLIHQLFLDDTDLALLLFDCSDNFNPFQGIPYWAKALNKYSPSHAKKFLVSSRIDVSPVTIGRTEIIKLMADFSLDKYFSTSAKTSEGVDGLFSEIINEIAWDKIPRTTTPKLFQFIREFLLQKKEMGFTLISVKDLERDLKLSYLSQGKKDPKHKIEIAKEILTVVSLLQGKGLVYLIELSKKDQLVLLKPETINQYASSIIRAARMNPKDIGAVSERDVLNANINLDSFKRLELFEEKVLLEFTVELLIRHDLCFRELGMLIFPSQINLTKPLGSDSHPKSEVIYHFSGSIEAIYASLVVRLNYTDYFKREGQWKYSAEFSINGDKLGFAMKQIEEGTGEIEIFFYPEVSEFDRVTFIRFLTDHLRLKGINIKEHIKLYCPECTREIDNLDAVESRVKSGKLDITCQYCNLPVIIPHSIEERYRNDIAFIKKQIQLKEIVEKRTKQEVQAFLSDPKYYSTRRNRNIIILHISDIHFGTLSESLKYRTQLETDLINGIKTDRLDYLVISGDIGNYSLEEEYNAGIDFLNNLIKRFGLDSSRLVVCPGNHDLNWDIAENAYKLIPKRKIQEAHKGNNSFPAGEAGIMFRNEDEYKNRFNNFNNYFYKKLYGGIEYPSNYLDQGIIHTMDDDKIAFITLNSCWEIDHFYQNRSSINMDSLSAVLLKLMDSKYNDYLKIAVWHHPIIGKEAMNDEFMQLLSVNRFQICMSGHIHEAKEGFYKYDTNRGIHLVGAGTFGAPIRQQVPSIPLQYNFLVYDPTNKTMIVETRKKEKKDGAWEADARWEDKNSPTPRYQFDLY